MLEILTDITEGRGKEGDIEILEDVGTTIVDSALCALGGTAPNPVLTTIRYFREEYEEHIKNKRCPAGDCNRAAPQFWNLHTESSPHHRDCRD